LWHYFQICHTWKETTESDLDLNSRECNHCETSGDKELHSWWWVMIIFGHLKNFVQVVVCRPLSRSPPPWHHRIRILIELQHTCSPFSEKSNTEKVQQKFLRFASLQSTARHAFHFRIFRRTINKSLIDIAGSFKFAQWIYRRAVTATHE
jgi:hypothetical protein